jgi:hypothetical protein
MIAIIVSIYILGIISFHLWDSFIGFPREWDDIHRAPLWFAALIWPTCTLIALQTSFTDYLEKSKKARIDKENQEVVRFLAAKQEEAFALEQFERELRYEQAQTTNNTKSG